MEAVICQLCREPIWNFLCTSCLSDTVNKWMPATLVPEFNGLNNTINQYLKTTPDNYEPCLKCDRLNETALCPHCYTHEVFHWLKGRNVELAGVFSKIFFYYKFEGAELLLSNTPPLTNGKNKRESDGSCDNCGSESTYLNNLEGEWYCETCIDGG